LSRAPSHRIEWVKIMNDEKLYGLTALFDSPDKIVLATRAVVKEGYKAFDIYTPYPVHGVDRGMRLKQSRIGLVTLIFGLMGVALALLLTWWTNSVNYPLIIGGKPFWALPAYIPVTFELSVLFGAVFTILGLLVIFFGFPQNVHPLHGTDFMKRVSSDRFGICIEAVDPKFDSKRTADFLQTLGSEKIEPIYYSLLESPGVGTILNRKFLLSLLFVAAVSSGLTYLTLNKLLFLHPWISLAEQIKVLPESRSTFYVDGFAMRQPVQGTVARGHMPYAFVGNMKGAEKFMINPLTPTKQVMELGRRDFNAYCSPCHGYFGDGDSRLQGQFPNPPSLHSDALRQASDGHFFHVITEGFRNVMPSYDQQIPEEERWAIIWYIRALQRAKHAKETDVP